MKGHGIIYTVLGGVMVVAGLWASFVVAQTILERMGWDRWEAAAFAIVALIVGFGIIGRESRS
jgi:hypothetical protein